MSPRYPKLAAAIKTARLKKKLSQEHAAELVGTTRFQWIRWEQGLHMPTEYRDKLVEVLGLPEDVFGDDEEPAADQDDLVASLMSALDNYADARLERTLKRLLAREDTDLLRTVQL